MPKIKTNKTATKRVTKITASGILVRRKTQAQHLVARKSRRTIKASGSDAKFQNAEGKKIRKLIPYRNK